MRLAVMPIRSEMHVMTKSYDPPLTVGLNGPLYRVDKAIKLAQKRLDTAMDAKRLHTSHSLANEVVKEAREALRKAEQARVLKIAELGAAAEKYRQRPA
ncbi:hypothetical protein [Stenotrophomonas pictorum]|nr:hypothetical protein [Stenotrophomonas pictorum]